MTQDTLDRPVADDAEDLDAVDLAFVGAGASTAYVLIALLAALGESPPEAPVRIAVVERAPDAFSGVAYGSRAARTSLLITPLRDFLPPGELRRFTGWLAENKHRAFDEFLAVDGEVSSRWWARHRDAVARDDFDDLYLPRYVFGTYLMERAYAAIAAAEAAGVAATEVIRDDVLAARPDGPGYRLTCGGGEIRARNVVLALGCSPVMPRLPGDDGATAAALEDDPFGHGMDVAMARVEQAITRPGIEDRPPHVVLIGGNAGTMDMLYQLRDSPVVAERAARITVLSPRGELPERIREAQGPVDFRPERLHALSDAEPVRAAAVFEAALEDLARGRAAGLSVCDTLRPISDGVVRVLPRLSHEEALEFAGHWGVELGRHQRRAGWEYHEVVEELATAGRLQVVAGSFTGVRGAGRDGVLVGVRRDGVETVLDDPADAVINCGGPVKHVADATPSLVAGLIESGVCRPTRHGSGIVVDETLAAAPGMFVMGPLLAGNVVNGGPVWHMEHCGRISSFGSVLGRELAGTLLAPQRPAAVEGFPPPERLAAAQAVSAS
ncbi:FAD/NAD(P)-binding protein [Blastococcus sp. TML/M2B]|uniref:FAD/NAD(P)-binding protein n=1 Tax=unclassified Blastococcus TaxID=2619396 RepID=UPI00190AB4DB|nr:MULTISPECIES: FAD/NAD(P)-binding protein [unclassified Blastococcus]MBN1091277.1 FAD/NAD(P)-binding protein [Blastococcus sp. TML/M2B]MBN1095165.1 FAD/NAD(P)-binding protein [Blastococcus sp. TML/C7B]